MAVITWLAYDILVNLEDEVGHCYGMDYSYPVLSRDVLDSIRLEVGDCLCIHGLEFKFVTFQIEMVYSKGPLSVVALFPSFGNLVSNHTRYGSISSQTHSFSLALAVLARVRWRPLPDRVV